MSLTTSHGPLAGERPRDVNYRVEGPERLLFFGDFPRRVRAVFGDQTVVGTRRGRLLHETNLHAAGRTAVDAVWAYPTPLSEASWLRGYRTVSWEPMDAWFDEEEQVFGHLRDPFHRVDVRAASGRARVVLDGTVVAESTRAKVLSETGLRNRYYLPREDVHVDLRPSPTSQVCPYKGSSSYWSTPAQEDVAWSYEAPLDDAARIFGHLCFTESASVAFS
jgi:uncharacterized protein (DUF427 family)